MGLGLAIKAFFSAFKNDGTAERVAAALDGSATANVSAPALEPPKERVESERSEASAASGRGGSDATSALTLLAALQREARFVDFIKESLDGADEAAIGAAARGVHDRCATVLERFFAIRPLVDAEEGAPVELDAETAKNSARVRVLGRTATPDSNGKVAGRLVHAGWIATKATPPVWSGAPEDVATLAPMEIE
ncbi:MAG: DUF2760 domain-containing protein [Thermoguttaceae bacterium]|nr:DUF2760 domain-containing protein [Thermoguttaceae bacterium]